MESTLPLDKRDLENIDRIERLVLDINSDMQRYMKKLKPINLKEFGRLYFPLLLQREELLYMLNQYGFGKYDEFVQCHPEVLEHERWDPVLYPDMSWLEN